MEFAAADGNVGV